VAAACLFVAGALAATLPGPAFTVAWTHSVARTRWVESYRVEAATLRLVAASVEGSGAGMEPPPEAVLQGGRWQWHPDRTLPELALAASPHAADYALCDASGCRELADLVGPLAEGQPVVIRPCPPR
jgi:hypothetical protein